MSKASELNKRITSINESRKLPVIEAIDKDKINAQIEDLESKDRQLDDKMDELHSKIASYSNPDKRDAQQDKYTAMSDKRKVIAGKIRELEKKLAGEKPAPKIQEASKTITGDDAFDLRKAFGKVIAGDRLTVKYTSESTQKPAALTYIITQVVSNVELRADSITSPVHKQSLLFKLGEDGKCNVSRTK